jgi:hypothetical protein
MYAIGVSFQPIHININIVIWHFPSYTKQYGLFTFFLIIILLILVFQISRP